MAQPLRERIDFRISAENKDKIMRASDYLGEKMSDFILKRVLPEAERLLEQQKRIRLNEQQWDSFLAMMTDPAPASKGLKSSMAKYRKNQGV